MEEAQIPQPLTARAREEGRSRVVGIQRENSWPSEHEWPGRRSRLETREGITRSTGSSCRGWGWEMLGSPGSRGDTGQSARVPGPDLSWAPVGYPTTKVVFNHRAGSHENAQIIWEDLKKPQTQHRCSRGCGGTGRCSRAGGRTASQPPVVRRTGSARSCAPARPPRYRHTAERPSVHSKRGGQGARSPSEGPHCEQGPARLQGHHLCFLPILKGDTNVPGAGGGCSRTASGGRLLVIMCNGGRCSWAGTQSFC